MTLYYVGDEEFLRLREAKKAMKRTGLPGFKIKVWSNGDWDPCGEINLSGQNKCHVVGDRNTKQY